MESNTKLPKRLVDQARFSKWVKVPVHGHPIMLMALPTSGFR